MKGLKKTKEPNKTVSTQETDQDVLAKLFTAKPVTITEDMTELERAALRDEWLDRRNILVRSLVEQTEGNISAISFIKDQLRNEYGSKFGEMPNKLTETEAGQKVSLKDLESIMKFATRLLYATEYSLQYDNGNGDPKTCHRITLTPNELKERMNAFAGLVYKMSMGWKPLFTWGINNDTLPKIAWDKA